MEPLLCLHRVVCRYLVVLRVLVIPYEASAWYSCWQHCTLHSWSEGAVSVTKSYAVVPLKSFFLLLYALWLLCWAAVALTVSQIETTAPTGLCGTV